MRHFAFLPALLLAGALSATASIDNALLSLVPSSAKFVGSVDVTRARSSEFGQYLLAKAQSEDAHFQEMIDQTGFDPRRDLQNLIFASAGPDAAAKPSFLILARGNFDPNRIKTLASAKGATVQTYSGVSFIVHSKDASQQTAVAFPQVGVAVMADLDTLKQVIDNLATPAMLDTVLQNKINDIGSNNDAWFVSLIGGSFLADHGNNAAPQAKALQAVVQCSGGVKLGSMIDTTFDAVTRSTQDALSLSDVIRFMASLVQMQRQNDPRAGILASALDGMTLQNSGPNVHFAVSMPEKSLEQLADSAHRPVPPTAVH